MILVVYSCRWPLLQSFQRFSSPFRVHCGMVSKQQKTNYSCIPYPLKILFCFIVHSMPVNNACVGNHFKKGDKAANLAWAK